MGILNKVSAEDRGQMDPKKKEGERKIYIIGLHHN